MVALSSLHNELRVRIPDKPYELYNDSLRWAIDKICRRTSMWKIITTLTTVAGQSIYNLDLPANTVTHSNLKIIHGSRTITRPVNGAINLIDTPSDSIQSFDSYGKNQIQISPTPLVGGETLLVHTAIKPVKGADEIQNDKLFDEYSDTIVHGALHRLFEDDENYPKADREEMKFNKGVSSIKVDVLKGNANTPMKLNAGW